MLATIDWVNLHDKIGFFIVVAAIVGAIVALLSLVTPFALYVPAGVSFAVSVSSA